MRPGPLRGVGLCNMGAMARALHKHGANVEIPMASDIILVPIDYTGCGFEVAATASEYAKRLDAEVVLLSVVNLPEGVRANTIVHPLEDLGDGVDVSTYLDRDAIAHLEPMARMVREQGCPTRLAIRHGDPCDAILTTAGDVGATLIVMGTHGRQGLRRLLQGSVAENVIRQASIPVMTVRTLSPELHPGKTVAQLQAEAEANG